MPADDRAAAPRRRDHPGRGRSGPAHLAHRRQGDGAAGRLAPMDPADGSARARSGLERGARRRAAAASAPPPDPPSRRPRPSVTRPSLLHEPPPESRRDARVHEPPRLPRSAARTGTELEPRQGAGTRIGSFESPCRRRPRTPAARTRFPRLCRHRPRRHLSRALVAKPRSRRRPSRSPPSRAPRRAPRPVAAPPHRPPHLPPTPAAAPPPPRPTAAAPAKPAQSVPPAAPLDLAEVARTAFVAPAPTDDTAPAQTAPPPPDELPVIPFKPLDAEALRERASDGPSRTGGGGGARGARARRSRRRPARCGPPGRARTCWRPPPLGCGSWSRARARPRRRRPRPLGRHSIRPARAARTVAPPAPTSELPALRFADEKRKKERPRAPDGAKTKLLIAGGIAAILVVATGWAWVPQLIQAGRRWAARTAQKPAVPSPYPASPTPPRRRCHRGPDSRSINCRTSRRRRSRSS